MKLRRKPNTYLGDENENAESCALQLIGSRLPPGVFLSSFLARSPRSYQIYNTQCSKSLDHFSFTVVECRSKSHFAVAKRVSEEVWFSQEQMLLGDAKPLESATSQVERIERNLENVGGNLMVPGYLVLDVTQVDVRLNQSTSFSGLVVMIDLSMKMHIARDSAHLKTDGSKHRWPRDEIHSVIMVTSRISLSILESSIVEFAKNETNYPDKGFAELLYYNLKQRGQDASSIIWIRC